MTPLEVSVSDYSIEINYTPRDVIYTPRGIIYDVYSTGVTYDGHLQLSFTIIICLNYRPPDCPLPNHYKRVLAQNKSNLLLKIILQNTRAVTTIYN